MAEVDIKAEVSSGTEYAVFRGSQVSELLAKLRGLSESTKLKIKLGISAVLFASLFLFGKIDLTKSWQAARQADMRFVVLAVVIYLSTVFINAYRWKLLAQAVSLASPFAKLAQYSFIGLFFNLFFPSTVGGDFSRCYFLYKDTGNYRGAFYSVLADRAVGISVLFLFASVAMLLGPGGEGLPMQLRIPIFIGTFGVFCVVPLLPFLTRLTLGESNWLSRQFNQSAAKVFWQDKGLILGCFLLSTLLQVIVVGCHISIGYALGLTSVPLWYYFVFYPSVAVLGFITPSFNGIGIREWAYTYFLMLVGVDRASALTYAIMWLGLTTISSLVGGIVYLAGHFNYSKAEAEELRHQAL